jgi:hypothetical protein
MKMEDYLNKMKLFKLLVKYKIENFTSVKLFFILNKKRNYNAFFYKILTTFAPVISNPITRIATCNNKQGAKTISQILWKKCCLHSPI